MDFQFLPVKGELRKDVERLSVYENQKGYIETAKQCMKEADKDKRWHPAAIFLNSQLIGFTMYGFFQDEGTAGRAWLDRFFIDKNHQGKGYGSACLPILIEHIQNCYHRTELYLSVIEENETAISLYKKNGFVFNGEVDLHNEKVMVLQESIL